MSDLTKKEVPKKPAAYLSGIGGTAKYEELGEGRTRITVYHKGKEVESYIEDDNQPTPWWKLW